MVSIVARPMLAAFALAVMLGCAPIPLRQRSALLCAAPDGQGFRLILDPTADYATYQPLGETETAVLKLEERDGSYVLRNGYGVVVIMDRGSGKATLHSDMPLVASPFVCERDPSPPLEIPEPRAR